MNLSLSIEITHRIGTIVVLGFLGCLDYLKWYYKNYFSGGGGGGGKVPVSGGGGGRTPVSGGGEGIVFWGARVSLSSSEERSSSAAFNSSSFCLFFSWSISNKILLR